MRHLLKVAQGGARGGTTLARLLLLARAAQSFPKETAGLRGPCGTRVGWSEGVK